MGEKNDCNLIRRGNESQQNSMRVRKEEERQEKLKREEKMAKARKERATKT